MLQKVRDSALLMAPRALKIHRKTIDKRVARRPSIGYENEAQIRAGFLPRLDWKIA
jgi:hypothetical protein